MNHVSFGYGLLIFAFGLALGAAFQALYRRGFDAGEKAGEQGSVRLSKDDLENVYWLAINGFQRLLVLGERGPGGFQSLQQAERAHDALDRLEYYLPKDQVSDASFDRMGKLAVRWPDGPLSPPKQLLKQQWLDDEP